MEIVNFIRKHPEHKLGDDTIAAWITMASGLSVNAYADKMAKTSEWGTGLEIAVCSALKEVNVHVHQKMYGRIIEFNAPLADSSIQTVHICYDGVEHYDALNVHRDTTTRSVSDHIGAALNHALNNNFMTGGGEEGAVAQESR